MGAQNQTTVTLVAVGGVPPYAYTIIAGAETTITASIIGTLLTVDATALNPGFYSVLIQSTDADGNTSQQAIRVQVLPITQFAVLNTNIAYQPNAFPLSISIPLTEIGGVGSISWTLIPGVTTLPGVVIASATITAIVSTYGTWTVGIQAVDALGNIATQLIEVSSVTAQVTKLTDAQVEIVLSPDGNDIGTQSFSLEVVDSGSSVVNQTFSYNIGVPVSTVLVAEDSINYVWGAGDTTTVVYPIAGDLTGFSLAAENVVTAENGLTVTFDAVNNALIISGPPVNFQNAEVSASIALLRSGSQVALVTREYTLIAHNGTTDIGTMTCNTRPYITGELVGLNPLRPYYDSPTWIKNPGYLVQLATGSVLPSGLSLDATSGQIYGNVLAGGVPQSILQYVDTSGTIHGTITVVWDICESQFSFVSSLTAGQVQAPYSATVSSSSSAALTSVAVHRGILPLGLSASISGGNVLIAGSPTEAGYFDLWFQVTNATGQFGFFYARLVVDYIPPLVILTESLPTLVSNLAYTITLQAFGGVQPYTWSLAAGTLPSGLTLNASSGVLSGTTAVTSYNVALTVEVTDERGVASTQILSLILNNALIIITPALPVIIPGQSYSYQMLATGGQPPYTWSLAGSSPALPTGMFISADGLVYGATSLSSYNADVQIKVTDTVLLATTATFDLEIGPSSGLIIDTEGVGPIIRGKQYQGLLSVSGPGVAPYLWSVTPDTPNAMPAGLTLSTDATTNGVNATIAGITEDDLFNFAVKIQVVDSNGNSGFAFLLLTTISSIGITTTSVPQGTVSGAYSLQFAATGINTPFTWAKTGGSLPAGLNLSSSGLLSGTPTVAGTSSFTITVTDTLGDTAAATFSLVVKASTLAITTASLANITAGFAYSKTFAATGGTPAYKWSISPASASGLPTGMSLAPTTGILSGTSTQVGFAKTVTFRVTDSIGVVRDVALALSVVAGLALFSGPDYIAGSANHILGMVHNGNVTSINPRPNLSFFVIAEGVISSQASQMSFGLPVGYSATATITGPTGGAGFPAGAHPPAALSGTASLGNIAFINITGPFATGATGSNNFAITVVDSGVSKSFTFVWILYAENPIFLTPATGAFPVVFLN